MSKPPHTKPVTIRFTTAERKLIEANRQKGERFGDVVRRLTFRGVPMIVRARPAISPSRKDTP